MAKQYRDQEFLVKLGKRVYNIRKGLDLTQEQLSELSGIDVRQIGRLERAERNSSVSLVKKIAEVLNLTIGELSDFSSNEEL